MTEPMPTWNNPSTDKWVMNSEPLSTKQLHEIITAQNMTIDRLLDDKSHYMEVVRKLYDDINKIKEMLIKCKFYEAWIEINKLID